MNLRPEAVPTLPLPPGIGIYIIHQPNDSEGTAQSHRNTQLSFPPPIESRAGSSGNPVLTRGIWIPACAGMTIYSRCVDTYAHREKAIRRAGSGGDRPVHGHNSCCLRCDGDVEATSRSK